MITANVANKPNMEHYAATIADEVTARCSACGTTWRYARHEALACPFCAATFIEAHFGSTAPVTYVDFEASGGCTAR